VESNLTFSFLKKKKKKIEKKRKRKKENNKIGLNFIRNSI